MEEHQSGEEQQAMVADQSKDALPIQASGSCIENMRDVGAIKALPRQYEQLGGEQFFRRQNPSGDIEHDGGVGALDPGAVHAQGAVAHTADEIHEIVIAMGLGQPNRIGHIHFEVVSAQAFERARGVIGGHEKVQVFGIAPDAGVMLQRKGARNSVRNFRVAEQLQGVAKQLELVRRKLRRVRAANRQRSLCGHPRFDDAKTGHGCGNSGENRAQANG